jgi:hypothetical protein
MNLYKKKLTLRQDYRHESKNKRILTFALIEIAVVMRAGRATASLMP